MTSLPTLGASRPPETAVELVRWLETQDSTKRRLLAQEALTRFLGQATRGTQSKSVSGNACLQLFTLVDQSLKSKCEDLKLWAVSSGVVEQLFTFYVEWNESDHHRSMKLILDLIPRLIKANGDEEATGAIKANLLQHLLSIVTGRSTKPLAKSAMQMLEQLSAKGVFSLSDIRDTYLEQHAGLSGSSEMVIWEMIFSDLLEWMRVHFVCPAAGKFIVCLYRAHRRQQAEPGSVELSAEVWQQWLLKFLESDSSRLEGIKNYIFLPLYKSDRSEALLFLHHMNQRSLAPGVQITNVDVLAMLRLAALEVGKKCGYVEEPRIEKEPQTGSGSSIVLHESVLGRVLSHPSHEVRMLALSLLVTSPSTTRPYSSLVFEYLRQHLPATFADHDPRFRVEASGIVRDMFKRLVGAIVVLRKSIPRARAKARKTSGGQPSPDAAVVQPAVFKANTIDLAESQLQFCLDYHHQFLQWYITFLRRELIPTASYQRHVATLKAVMNVLRIVADSSSTWHTSDDLVAFYEMFDPTWARTLLDLVMDPFEDVRQLAVTILQSVLTNTRFRCFRLMGGQGVPSPREELKQLHMRANEIASRTSRADHSDGAAKSCQLLYRFCENEEQRVQLLERLTSQLEARTDAAERDLGAAVIENPLHGILASICSTWQVVAETKVSPSEMVLVQGLQDRIVSCCERIWLAVRDVLCDDSPEGHLPEELEDVDGLDTKDLLSFSFRAVHEASNVMRAMALTLRNRASDTLVSPSQHAFEKIGNLTFLQLSTLRHRGAFTTVSSTFATCCQQSRHVVWGGGEKNLLKAWYDGALNEIMSQKSMTRRSAGIPSLLTGILSADAQSPSFEEVMEKLMEIAAVEESRMSGEEVTSLPQVHAFNCLRAVFKNSLLASMGNKAERYLTRCLELAANALRSDIWAIRNCGLIFLRSLIDCLFGSTESKAAIEAGWDGKAHKIHYHRYSNLPDVLVKLLQPRQELVATVNTSAAESVFPALDIIRRAGPPEALRDKLQRHVAVYLASPVWHLREMAARTLCSCLLHDGWFESTKDMVQAALLDESENRQNHVHGAMLFLRIVMERRAELAPQSLLDTVRELAMWLNDKDILRQYPYCPDIAATYLEVVNKIWLFQLSLRQPLAKLTIEPLPARWSALLKSQSAINQIISASQDRAEGLEKLRDLLFADGSRVSGLVPAIEIIPCLWPVRSSTSSLGELCQLYMEICQRTDSTEVRVVSLESLSQVLDALLENEKLELVPQSLLLDLWTTLLSQQLSLALADAVIRTSGSIMAVFFSGGTLSPDMIRNWGQLIAEAGSDDRPFDTRLAAAEALKSFFNSCKAGWISADMSPILVALYDALNDDDEDVREVAALAAKRPLGRLLVSLEAAESVLQLLGTVCSGSSSFKALVASRILGHGTAAGAVAGDAGTGDLPRAWPPAREQLAEAIDKPNDALFIVEDQNLFRDEVREMRRWLSVFESLQWVEQNDSTVRALQDWISEGLEHMAASMVRIPDGPLGWTSDPDVFAICSRIFLTAKHLEKMGLAEEGRLKGALTTLRGNLAVDDSRFSGLLAEMICS